MKRLFLVLLLLAVVPTLMAIPARRGRWSTITLSDGREVRVEHVGDEHAHWLRAADGTCYVKSGESYVHVDPAVMQAKQQRHLHNKLQAIYSSTSDGLGQKGRMSPGAIPSIGEYTIPLVMVQFANLKFKSSTTVEKMRRYYNEEGYHDEAGTAGSVRDYFKAQSGGQFIPTFDVVGVVTLPYSYEYYGANDREGNDKHLYQLPGDVIAAAASQLGVDFTPYVVPAADENHAEGVPLLAMFYAGKGEATEDYSANYLWPCEWEADEDSIGKGNYNGVHFNSFLIGNELLGDKLMGMSVFCHEFSHALGLPDFYCTDYSYGFDDPFGLWSLMDSGVYVDDECRMPSAYTAYEKSFLGWLELKELGKTGSITLQSPDGIAENSAYIVRNSTYETFIFENHQSGAWSPYSFGSGVLVTRIAYNKKAWEDNTINKYQTMKRACVVTADGERMYYSASPSNLYGNGVDAISQLWTVNKTLKNIGIKRITKNDDGTITLVMTEEHAPAPETGIDEVGMEPSSADGIYTLSGVRVAEMRHGGMYVVVKGGRSRKILYR